jgi:2-amino-4-hydroxy-6-hydroxymethyldihydropteridine diphosphokinase
MNLDRPRDGVDIPREEIRLNAFVLRPLADLAGDCRHPVDGRTYRELWQSYRSDQKLWPIEFHWP